MINHIKQLANETLNDAVVKGIGSFGACLDPSKTGSYTDPLYILSCDGVGSKMNVICS